MKTIINLDACFTPPSASLAPDLRTLHNLRCIKSLAHHAKTQGDLIKAVLIRIPEARFRFLNLICGTYHPYDKEARQVEVILAFGKAL